MDSNKSIGFGCVALTTLPTVNEALYLLNTAHENGINHFDTAPIYGQGYSEILLGKFLLDKKREEIIITTKCGLGNIKVPQLSANIALPLNFLKKSIKHSKKINIKIQSKNPVPFRSITLDQVRFDFYNSLKRLKTEYIDNYLLHEATPKFLTNEATNFLFDLKKKGLIKNIGIGVSYLNLIEIDPGEIENWDILQYDFNIIENPEKIYLNNPGKQNIHHSIFKNYNLYNFPGIPDNEKGGFLIANHISKYKDAKVLFTSTRTKNIINNLKYANFYINKL
ncbi:MAG: aldo/keto reductase [Bacteroidota bacterium]|nr:aldo/keto reductase [Bacteroidota bacterium]